MSRGGERREGDRVDQSCLVVDPIEMDIYRYILEGTGQQLSSVRAWKEGRKLVHGRLLTVLDRPGGQRCTSDSTGLSDRTDFTQNVCLKCVACPSVCPPATFYHVSSSSSSSQPKPIHLGVW